MRSAAAVIAVCFAVPCAPALAHEVGAPAGHGPDPAAIDGPPRAGAASEVAAASWCGRHLPTDDPEHELDNGEHRYQAIYAVPADAPSRLSALGPRIQADALEASGLVERLYGRAIRYDMGTSCGPGNLDIVTLRLPVSGADLQQLAGTETGTMDAVAAALDAAGFAVIKPGEPHEEAAARTRNWVVWLDGPAPAGTCGQAMLFDDRTRSAQNPNDLAGKVALVYREGDGFCGANTVRHEILHNLGALQAGSPHESGGHCTDALEDAMCLPSAPAVDDGSFHSRFVDYGNDDYWDPPGGPPLGWWTVNLSRFLCADASCNGATAGAFAGRSSPGHAAPAGKRQARVRVKVRRIGPRWRIALRARGGRSGTVTVRCRTRGGRVAIVLQRHVRLPRRVLARVRCTGQPRARVVLDHR